MKLTLRAGSIVRSGPERLLVDDYLRRAQGLVRGCGFSEVTEQQVDLRSCKTRASETQKLLDVGELAQVIVLDEKGRNVSSMDIAKTLRQYRDDRVSELVFIIGGADGFDPKSLPKHMIKWSFGQQTWPHKMVRVMMAEQLYRALSIIAGTPYHRS